MACQAYQHFCHESSLRPISAVPRGPKGDGQPRRASSVTHRASGRFLSGKLLQAAGRDSAGAPDRIAQPVHGEFVLLRLQVAPALDLGLVAVLGEALEVLTGELAGGGALPGELLANELISGHAPLKRGLSRQAIASRTMRGEGAGSRRRVSFISLQLAAAPIWIFTISGLSTRSACRLSARRVAMRANSIGPPRSAALVISSAAVRMTGVPRSDDGTVLRSCTIASPHHATLTPLRSSIASAT